MRQFNEVRVLCVCVSGALQDCLAFLHLGVLDTLLSVRTEGVFLFCLYSVFVSLYFSLALLGCGGKAVKQVPASR